MSTPAPPRPSSASGPSLSPTQQQLDDLEALMHRMLALPVNRLGEDEPPVPAVAEVPASSPPPRFESDLDRILAEFPAKSWPSREDPIEEAVPEESDRFTPAPPSPPLAAESGDPRRAQGAPTGAADVPEPVAEEPAVPAPLPGEDRPDTGSLAEALPPTAAEVVLDLVVPPPEEQAIPAAWSNPPPVRREIAPSRHPAEPAPAPPVPEAPPVPLVFRPLVWVNDGFDVCTLCLGPLGRGLRGRWGRALLGLAGLLLLAAAAAWGVCDWMGWTW